MGQARICLHLCKGQSRRNQFSMLLYSYPPCPFVIGAAIFLSVLLFGCRFPLLIPQSEPRTLYLYVCVLAVLPDSESACPPTCSSVSLSSSMAVVREIGHSVCVSSLNFPCPAGACDNRSVFPYVCLYSCFSVFTKR